MFISSEMWSGVLIKLISPPSRMRACPDWVSISCSRAKASKVTYPFILLRTPSFSSRPWPLAVTSVVDTVTRLPSVPARLLVYTDNSNTVDIFHSLRSLPPYNDLLKFTVSLLIKFNISLRVVHVPGVDNDVADALSRFDNARALAACPGLSISSFQPPRIALGQEK